MKKWAGLVLLLLTLLIFFSRILSGEQLYVSDDLIVILYPLEYIFSQFQQNWSLPVWAGEFGFGQPLLAWNQLGFFTPIHILLRMFSLHSYVALNLSMIIHIALTGIGMYIFLRREKLSDLASALGAITFAFCGFMIGHLMHVNFYVATSLLPWILLTTHWLIMMPGPRPAAVLSGLIAAAIVSAHPQASLYTILAATIYGLVFISIYKIRHVIKVSAFTLAAAVLAFSLSSLTLLPLFEFIPVSDRSGDLPLAELLDFSYEPAHALTFVYPYFFGGPQTYWGARNFQELAGHVGIIPLLLAGAALIDWQNHKRLKIAAVTILSIGVVLALGKYSPVYKFLIENHIVTNLNVPGRFIYWVNIGLTLLAAAGLDDLRQLKSRRRLYALLSGLGLASLPFIALTYASLTNEHVARQLPNITRLSHPSTALIIIGLTVFFLWYTIPKKAISIGLVSVTALTLIWYGWNYNPTMPTAEVLTKPPFADNLRQFEDQTGLPARLYSRQNLLHQEASGPVPVPTKQLGPLFSIQQVIPSKIAAHCFTLQMYAPLSSKSTIQASLSAEKNVPPIQTITISAADIHTRQDQVLCFETASKWPDSELLLTISAEHQTDINLYYQDNQLAIHPLPPTAAKKQPALLPPNMQALASTSGARWASALAVDSYQEFIQKLLSADGDTVDGEGKHVLRRNRHIFNMAGITHFTQLLSPGSIDLMPEEGFTIEDEYKIGEYTARLYGNPQAFPKAFLVNKASWHDGKVNALQLMTDPDFDFTSNVFLSGPTKPNSLPDSGSHNTGEVNITKYTPAHVDIQTNTTTPAVLVLTDTTTPHWQTYIDNKPSPYYVANTTFKAAVVPTGQHQVSFKYESPAVAKGKMLATIGLAVFIICLFFKK